MKISPNVVEQNTNTPYTLTLKNTSNIESLEVLSRSDFYHKDTLSYKIEKNTLSFSYKMSYLGEFVIKVNFTYKESKLVTLYCLNKKMMELRPLKGDLHMHSIYSDGRSTPFAMVMASLNAGMDFVSVTDHDSYAGSLKAIEKTKQNNIDILVLAGEEVSVGGKKDMSISQGNGHILSIHANKSIENQRKDIPKYEKELEKIVQALKKEDIDINIDVSHYAKNIWVINKIKEAKGISILAHPNWIYKDGKYLGKVIKGNIKISKNISLGKGKTFETVGMIRISKNGKELVKIALTAEGLMEFKPDKVKEIFPEIKENKIEKFSDNINIFKIGDYTIEYSFLGRDNFIYYEDYNRNILDDCTLSPNYTFCAGNIHKHH